MKIKYFDKIISAVEKMDEKQRYYIFGGILVFILVLDYYILMRPQLGALTEINPKIQILKEDIKKAENDIQRLDQYSVEVEKLKEEVDVINLRVEARDDVPLILERISLMANQNNVRLEQIMPNTLDQEKILENNERSYYSLPILVEARAGYHNFGKFLNQIERSERFLNIDDFMISASNDTKNHAIKLRLGTVIYEVK